MSLLRRRMMMSRKGEEGDIYSERYLTIEALEDDFVLYFDSNGLEYCIDGSGEWMRLSYNVATEPINTGQTLHFRGYQTPNEYGVGSFNTDREFNVKGNVMSLLYGDDGYLNNSLEGKEYAFAYLFYLCENLKNVSPDFLPAKKLAKGCYNNMFEACINLETAPNLPAVELAEECYYYMFSNCSNLAIAPTLPAKKLEKYCYESMFSLCNHLKYIKMMATDISADGCMDYWVDSVASTGIFVKNKDATWDVTGKNGVPNGWTVLTE